VGVGEMVRPQLEISGFLGTTVVRCRISNAESRVTTVSTPVIHGQP
jgi:hypothetical protein